VNVGFLLANAARRHPGGTAVVDNNGCRTYSQLEARCCRLSGAFLKAGLVPGDRIALLSFNTIYLVEAYLAAIRVGLVAVPVNFRLSGKEMTYIIGNAGARCIVYGPQFDEAVNAIHGDIDSVDFFICRGRSANSMTLDYERFLESGRAVPCATDLSEHHPCQVMYTSGTTGRPKGAVITHSNVLWNLFNTIHGREDLEGQRSIIVGPLYHTAALNNHLTIQIALGGTSILVEKFDPKILLQIIADRRATTISGSPAMYNLLMQHPGARDYDTTSITKCTAGADKLPMATKQQLMDFFPHIKGIYDVYGCTEASPCIAILGADASLRKDGSVGRPLPFLSTRLVGREGQTLAPGEVGELICKGPNVMKGYYNDPQATAETIKNGWLHTGDLARSDEEGYLYIVDRKKDMIVSGGENIYPREIEEVLYTHPAVADAAVVGVPDPLWGEGVRAFIQLKPRCHLTEEEVIEYCRRHLAGYKKPRRVDFIEKVPRNPSGKAVKRELKMLS
jgi:fatty-acyl-CoA synthase